MGILTDLGEMFTNLFWIERTNPISEAATSTIPESAPPESAPYRKPVQLEPKNFKLSLEVTGADRHSEEVVQTCTAKAKRRALRFFRGEVVRHRSSNKKLTENDLQTNLIEFAWFRRQTDKTLRIRVVGIPLD